MITIKGILHVSLSIYQLIFLISLLFRDVPLSLCIISVYDSQFAGNTVNRCPGTVSYGGLFL